MGSKEGLSSMATAITAPGDVILAPSPSYPIHTFGFIIAGATIFFPLVCALLEPVTNKATDAGDRSRFKLLHTISVVLTMLVLLGNLAFPWV